MMMIIIIILKSPSWDLHPVVWTPGNSRISFFPHFKHFRGKIVCVCVQKDGESWLHWESSRLSPGSKGHERQEKYKWILHIFIGWSSCVTFWYKSSQKEEEKKKTPADIFGFERSCRNQRRAERRPGQLGAVATNGQKRATWCQLLWASRGASGGLR